MNLKTLIFSKNRACQLELLLRSLGDFPTSVLYSHDPEFKTGYKKLISMYPNVDFLKETNFKQQLIDFVSICDHILFLTDDDVTLAPFNLDTPELEVFETSKDTASLSLSLSPNIASTKWEWQKYRGNYRLRMWGYPMSIDSCIFKSADILPTIKANGVKNPNYLETNLNLNIPNKPFMMCFENPIIINNSVNQVQSDFPQKTSGPSPLELEQKFLSGFRISLDDIKEKAKSRRFYRMNVNYKFEK
mgnify:FL=1